MRLVTLGRIRYRYLLSSNGFDEGESTRFEDTYHNKKLGIRAVIGCDSDGSEKVFLYRDTLFFYSYIGVCEDVESLSSFLISEKRDFLIKKVIDE